MALIARDISCTYGAGTVFEKRALDGLDLEVAKGRTTLVLGPTGSGKTTLLRALAGLTPLSGGTVTVDGLDGSDAGRAASRGRVGIVFQDPATQLFAEDVLSDVMFGPLNSGLIPEEARAAAAGALEAVGLDPAAYGHRSPFGLSGGEARRAGLAGVLAMRPDYLLLDEPTAGLDAAGREAVREVLDALDPRPGVVLVSHDVEHFLDAATEVLVLAGGTSVFLGTPASLVRDPGPLAEAGLLVPETIRVQRLAEARGARVEREAVSASDVVALLAAAAGRPA